VRSYSAKGGIWLAWRKTDKITAENRRRAANVEEALESGKTDLGDDAKPPADTPA